MRVVVDTNVFLAGLLNEGGGAAKVVRHFRDGTFTLVVTREIFEEYARVIHQFDNVVPSDLSEGLLELVFEKAVKIQPTEKLGLCKDADDEKFLSGAVAGEAAYLVTKNTRHFPKVVSPTRIVSVGEFLRAVERRAPGPRGGRGERKAGER